MSVLLEPSRGEGSPPASVERHEIETVAPRADDGRGIGALACSRSVVLAVSVLRVLEHDVERAVVSHDEAGKERLALEDRGIRIGAVALLPLSELRRESRRVGAVEV